jgi:hypothetical protein
VCLRRVASFPLSATACVLGFRALGFKVAGSGFLVSGFGFRVKGFRSRVRVRVQGLARQRRHGGQLLA